MDHLSPGYTLEELDDYPTSGTDDIDALTVPLDSTLYIGGLRTLSAFNASHKLGSFGGDNLAAEIGTSETEIFPLSRSLISNVRPIIDTSAATASLSFRNRIADSFTTTASSSMHSTGNIPLRKSARYFKFNLAIPEGTTWSDAQGIDIEATNEGYR